MFSAMKYEQGNLKLIDQRKLPHQEVWLDCKDLEAVAEAIEVMVVRGAPAIGCTAAYGFAIDALVHQDAGTWKSYHERFEMVVKRLAATRPTAVNLFESIERFQTLAETFENPSMHEVAEKFENLANELFEMDLGTCRAIGKWGAEEFRGTNLGVLTHCNTGSLATAGYGTALGVIRSLHQEGRLRRVYADETRPYLQGSRLTMFELTQDGIPATLLCDSAAAHLMKEGLIDAVVVGADRVAANGDSANKIGTYSVAVNAKHHGIPFYIAAPRTTIDPKIESGMEIPIEQREATEVSHLGDRPIAPLGIDVVNPSFDVTPASLIEGIITEVGVLKAPYGPSIAAALRS